MKTWTPNGKYLAEYDRKWFVIDAAEATLGRLSTRIANILTGKNKPTYTPHMDMGDHVVVVNAEKVNLTGNKLEGKNYYRHSNYPGGLKSQSAGEVLERHPERVIRSAVRGMLPKTRLGRKMLSKLKVYAGEDHPHQAQKPELITLAQLR